VTEENFKLGYLLYWDLGCENNGDPDANFFQLLALISNFNFSLSQIKTDHKQTISLDHE